VAKIIKKHSKIEQIEAHTDSGFTPNADICELSDAALTTVQNALDALGTQLPSDAKLYRYKNDILLVRSNVDISPILTRLYAIRFGMRIGRIEHATFEPQAPLGVHFVHSKLKRIDILPEMLHDFLR
jgi:hypothetical protein